MSIFGGSKVANVEKFQKYLVEGETVEQVYRLILDEICFTNKRIIFFDNKLVSKKKKRITIPYSSITHYAIEEAGRIDVDAEVFLFTRGGHDIELNFIKGTDMIEIEKIIAKHVCK